MHENQYHYDPQGMHDVNMHANIAKTIKNTKYHPVATGQQGDNCDPDPEEEIFKVGTEPTQKCRVHRTN